MLSQKQPDNAAAAAVAALVCGISETAVRKGLLSAVLPARFEYFEGPLPAVVDGAHNVDSAKDLADTTSSWPDFPSYHANVIVYFDMNKIDFTKKAELIFVQLPNWEKHFTIDFSKYK
jgi:folylpolyglutamate synthase/dihydropteroate synthase